MTRRQHTGIVLFETGYWSHGRKAPFLPHFVFGKEAVAKRIDRSQSVS
jgi:hypothetical protein